MSEEFDVFLSHTLSDELVVEALAGRLRNETELRPFFRRWMLIPGEPRVRAIERAIERSKTVAVFIGSEGPDAWQDEESRLAISDQIDRRVIPVLLPGASKSDAEGFLRTRTWVDIAETDGFLRLVAGIKGQAPELVAGFETRPGPERRPRVEPASPTPYRVFVSSTLRDDPERRRELLQTVEDVGMVPCGLEPIVAADGVSALDLRRQRLSESDLLVMIVAWRYGEILEGEDRSIFELEYEWACELEIPRLVFLVDEARPVVVPLDFDGPDQRWAKQSRLERLKSRLEAECSTQTFTSENLVAKLTHGVHGWRSDGASTISRARARARVAEASPPQAERPPPDSIRELSQYLEAIEKDSAATTIVGPMPLRVPLNPDDLRVSVRYDPSQSEDELGESDPEEPNPKLYRVFREAERRGCRGVALVGAAGAGKSTHLRRFALWLSRRNAKTLGLPIDTVPILLSVHELPEEIEDLREAIAYRDPRIDESLVDEILSRDHLLLLVDGLDELASEERRARVIAWLEEGLGQHPDARFLITRRPTEPGTGRKWSFPVLEVQLRPLGQEDARELVVRWFQSVEGEGAVAQARARRRADALWAELEAPEFRVARMFEIVRNPLMLTVLCMVYHRGGHLPRRRVEVYEQCVQVLVEQWCARGNLPRRIGEREARQILQPIAYWLHGERGRTQADVRAMAAAIQPHLGSALGYEQEVDAEVLMRSIVTDDGVLVDRGRDSYGLLHLGIQEYLCARHLRSLSHADSDVLERLADHFGDPWWREVLHLLLALGEPALFDPLMRMIVQRRAFAEHFDWVIECMPDAVQSSVEPFMELLRCAPGEEPELWGRQLAAARVLQKVEPHQMSELVENLRDHPLEELRLLEEQNSRRGSATRISPRGGYALVEIPAGRFKMGSHPRERGRRGGEGPAHQVELASFFMGTYPVTNEEYGLYLRACPRVSEPVYWGDPRYNRSRQPVVGVSWHEAMAYCDWAGLSLPTEAQWERACRGGEQTAYWSGREEPDLARIGWYANNSGMRPHPVGETEANAFGLHDLHGNVWEWCLDGFGDYAGHAPREGDGLRHEPLEDGNRMIRGGSWINPARQARAAYRLNRHADNRLAYLGFRAIECSLPRAGP